jgi:hypothetical protein
MKKLGFKQVFLAIWIAVVMAHFGSAYFFKWFIREDRLNSIERIHVQVTRYNDENCDVKFTIIDSGTIGLIKCALISGEYVLAPKKTITSPLDVTLRLEHAHNSYEHSYYTMDNGAGRCWYRAGGWNLGAYDDTLLAPILLLLVKAYCEKDSLQ